MNRNFALLALVAVLLVSCASNQSARITITDVTLIDGVAGVRLLQTVVIENDRLIAVRGTTAADRGQPGRIDGLGKYLIPGLWDFHVHLTYDSRFDETMPAMLLSYGVTSVRDTGGLMENMLPVVQRLRAPGAISPRVFFAGPLLDGNFVVYDGVGRPEIGVQNSTVMQARQRIAQLKEQGVDLVKVYELVSPEVFDALVLAAEAEGLPIASHVPLSMRASVAGPRVDSIEHLRNIEMDCASNALELHQTRLDALHNSDNLAGADLRASLHSLQRLPAVANYDERRCDQTIAALMDTTQVPTLRLNAMSAYPPFEREDWQQALARSPGSIQDAWGQQTRERIANPPPAADTRFAEWSLFLTGRMHEMGVPIAAGTDTPIGVSVPGYSLHSELEMLVRAGLTPLEALSSATLRPAEFFSLEQEMGSIEVGKRADVVLLDADPLLDIANAKSISAVISKGRYFTAEQLQELTRAD